MYYSNNALCIRALFSYSAAKHPRNYGIILTAMKEKSVVISLWSAGSCGRKQLAGILRYINDGHDWRVRIIMDPNDFTPQTVAEAEAQGVDGYIAFASNETAAALAKSETPTVLVSCPTPEIARRRHNLSMFVNDDDVIGRKGAEHFLSLGTFASFAFVPDLLGRAWSGLREKSFRKRLEEAGCECLTYRPELDDLADWLKSLPKPIAVMAPFDFRARDVAEACKRARLSVPSQVAILGVDNDDLVCEISKPTISSIALDQERFGYLAAKKLDSLMSSRRKLPSETVLMDSGDVVERESTRPVAPGVHLARRIQAFIDEHFKDGISVSDVPAKLHVSRRLAELRFSEVTGKTIREAIEDRRLAEIKRYLSSTSLPIAKISRLCGLRNDLWIKYVFKRRFGMTMTEWRESEGKRGD